MMGCKMIYAQRVYRMGSSLCVRCEGRLQGGFRANLLWKEALTVLHFLADRTTGEMGAGEEIQDTCSVAAFDTAYRP